MGIFCFNEMLCKQTMLMNITCTEVRSQLEMALVSPETDEICTQFCHNDFYAHNVKCVLYAGELRLRSTSQ